MKGTLIGIDLNGIFTDPLKWVDAEVFRPERHLNVEGKFFKNDLLIPFGSGILKKYINYTQWIHYRYKNGWTQLIFSFV